MAESVWWAAERWAGDGDRRDCSAMIAHTTESINMHILLRLIRCLRLELGSVLLRSMLLLLKAFLRLQFVSALCIISILNNAGSLRVPLAHYWNKGHSRYIMILLSCRGLGGLLR